MVNTRVLSVLVLAWTLLSWGGRIGLLTDAEATDPGDLLRIGGSLLLGWTTGAVLWWAPRRLREVRWLFVAWTVALWTRSLVVTWMDPPSIAFGLVHTVLAVGWFTLAWFVAPCSDQRIRDRPRVEADA